MIDKIFDFSLKREIGCCKYEDFADRAATNLEGLGVSLTILIESDRFLS